MRLVGASVLLGALAFLVSLLAAPFGVDAGQPEKLYRIGMLERTSAAINAANVDVRSKVDLILTRGTPAALAAKNATGTIPVIITGVGDPVGQGIVASLARPDANITGLSAAVTQIYPKRVQLLKELAPKATRNAYRVAERGTAVVPEGHRIS